MPLREARECGREGGRRQNSVEDYQQTTLQRKVSSIGIIGGGKVGTCHWSSSKGAFIAVFGKFSDSEICQISRILSSRVQYT